MTLYRAAVLDVVADPFSAGVDRALRVETDAGLLVTDGVVTDRGPFAAVRDRHPDDEVEDVRGGLLLPGFVDTHVHYPQLRAIGGLGMPLLDWLQRCALPEEVRFADDAYAAVVADEFLDGLARAGTTTALVFGAHFEGAMDAFFARAERSGLNVTSGLVLGDRLLRDELHCTPAAAAAASRGLIDRWHGRGRLRYAVTPRFSLSATDELLDVCGQLLAGGDVWFTSHVNENLAEVATVAGLFPGSGHYVGSYDRHGLVTDRSVFAHNVHATDDELALLADRGAAVSHCPTSNAALGSGLFPLRRHVEHGVNVALGSDVGAGTGLFVGKEALQAYFGQQLLGPHGLPLTPVHLLWLATAAGARALGLSHRTGTLGVGMDFDAVWIRPGDGTTLATNLDHADGPVDALARVFALATTADVAQTWAAGRPLRTPGTSSTRTGSAAAGRAGAHRVRRPGR